MTLVRFDAAGHDRPLVPTRRGRRRTARAVDGPRAGRSRPAGASVARLATSRAARGMGRRRGRRRGVVIWRHPTRAGPAGPRPMVPPTLAAMAAGIVTEPFLDAIRARVPGLRLLADATDRETYRRDETAYLPAGLPGAVALPTETAQVAELVRICAEFDVPIVPRGAGSGLSGGAAGLEGALTIAFTAMDRILEIDAANLCVVTQPGVINARLKAAVAEHGLFYAPDPASFEMCSIGGNLGHERRRPVLRQVRPDARRRALARGRDGRRRRHPDRRQEHQGRGRLLADPPDRRVAGDARAHHRGDPAAAAGARRPRPRCWRSSRRSSRPATAWRRSPPPACRR